MKCLFEDEKYAHYAVTEYDYEGNYQIRFILEKETLALFINLKDFAYHRAYDNFDELIKCHSNFRKYFMDQDNYTNGDIISIDNSGDVEYYMKLLTYNSQPLLSMDEIIVTISIQIQNFLEDLYSRRNNGLIKYLPCL